MAFIMKQRLEVGLITLHKILEAELTEGRKEPCAELRIKLPKGKGYNSQLIKKGQEVKWYAWYDGKLPTKGEILEFEGEVVDVSPKQPLEIVCRDGMFAMQQKKLSKNFYNVSIENYLQQIAPAGVAIKVDPGIAGLKVTMDTNGRSGAWAAMQLRKRGIDVFFRGGILYAQDPTKVISPSIPKRFRLTHNIIKDEVSTREGKDITIVVRSYQPETGRTLEGRFGKGDSHFVDVDRLSQKEALELAKSIYKEIAGKGLVGKFEAFGAPSVKHSEIIRFEDPDDSKRTKNVFVEKVVKTWLARDSKYRQNIHLSVVDFKGAE
ncbi:late control protein [Leptospira kanakyensis]|uniref:Late control protein n=1 Tax=Leptospira kanakyensis TaxID=2484968 RepID=A0A6N4PTD3_9LEPT|nr:late control protein [Leptospira kanakyensis]TGK47507.1 late control protein [Leptospira kanakyensis]TGK63490.1 late control protein [Leptospira kanakyensis]TGK67094.1 late control protein [Leptospira kanakyensis]